MSRQPTAGLAYDGEVADQLPQRMPPPINDANRAFWTGGANGELLIQYCAACQRWVHPPLSACDSCAGPLEPRAVSGRGTVFTFTVNRHAFNPTVPVPYVIAIVELVEQSGLRFTTDIVNCAVDDVQIGMPVEVLFEQAGEAWVPIFQPVIAAT
jgi:uncharacterized OB-fold protein